MNRDQVLAQFQRELRTLERPGETLEALPHVTRCSWTDGEINSVSAFSLTLSNVDDVIQGEIAHFGALGREFEWKVFSFDAPSNLLERLQVAGFEVGDREAVVVYDLNDGLEPFEGPYPCEVRRIVDPAQLGDFRAIAEAVFEKDYSLTTEQLREALRTGQKGHDAYIAYVEEKPIAIGRLYTDPNSAFGGLYGGGTLKDHRGHGYYRAVTAARAHDALASGARYLMVDALPTSLPILKRLGFVQLAETWPCSLAK